MDIQINPYFTQPDIVVLENLVQDVKGNVRGQPDLPEDEALTKEILDSNQAELDHDRKAISQLNAYNDPASSDFTPTIFTTWDDKDLPSWFNDYVSKPYSRFAMRIVRNPTDVVFATHLSLYLTVNVASAIGLFYRFSYIHGIAHLILTGWCVGPFTLLMHNHIHNNGILAKRWAWLDWSFPYLLEPLMGHTWDSYYYHHVKHHHVEGNGPDDLSSTLRYQRDDLLNFLHYCGRFMLFVWAELPLYFVRKGKINLAIRAFLSEAASYAFLYYMTRWNPRASTFVLILPFVALRFALMAGNWGQHALVDEEDPTSDFRTSITLIDVSSNRFCFNDGYHTAHHLNPRRHWREHPVHFLKSKDAYRSGRALVFQDIDFLVITIKLLQKDYMTLAGHLVPMGKQIGMSKAELAEMLRSKTSRFSEEEIVKKFKLSR